MKLKNKIEILAPAGGKDQLDAAVNFGADAVYLACQKFGMRAKAANFHLEELGKVADFAHTNGVKVYVTCNVLMHDSDINLLPEYFMYLEKAGVDAVILADMGAMSVVKEVAPSLDIHVSTQASVANTRSAIEWAKLGAKRIVLAREMSLKQIKEMRQALDNAGYQDKKDNPNALALEAFVHGAMCMSVSGRCLISSYLTGRSANKGLCTQPCRWGYHLEEEKRPGQKFDINEDDFGTYIMNSKDLNMLSFVDKLAEAGVSSLKIEGRNKKALYVATVVNAYRHVLDSLYGEDLSSSEFDKITGKWQQELVNVSHRPYSTGFYFGEAEQSQDYDGYEQNAVHVADVLECRECAGDSAYYVIKVLCRNRFENGEVLEALCPKEEPFDCKIESLRWVKENNKLGVFVDVANRAKEIYTFTTKHNVPSGSYLRSKTFLRTSR